MLMYCKKTEFLGTLIEPHQPIGVEWMYQKEMCTPAGGVLCDDMGMGKTIQCLALICKSPKKSLVVVPKSLVNQWEQATKQYTNISPFIVCKNKNLDNSVLTICTYNNLLSSNNDLHNTNWERIILDEGHIIRNRKTKMYQRVCDLSCTGSRFVLTGTPVFNVVDDVINLLCFIGFDNAECKDNLPKIKNDYFLRRIKNQNNIQIQCEIKDVKLHPNNQEKQVYYNVFNKQKTNIANSDEKNITLNVLNGILKCRQALIHPNLIEKDLVAKSSKIEMLKSEINKHLQDKCIIFCHFKKEMKIIKDEISRSLYLEDKISLIDGNSSLIERDEQLKNFETHGNVLIIQIKVGGVGLNLQHANHVYLTSPSWNPATDLQAIHRAYRTGQEKQVHVVRMFIDDIGNLPSIDIAIMHLQKQKQELSNKILEEKTNMNFISSNMLSELNDQSSIKYFAKIFNKYNSFI